MASLTNTRRLNPRQRRKIRIRKKVVGTAERPRLSVFRSARHIYAQLVDDISGATVASASTMAKDTRTAQSGKKQEKAKKVGLDLAAACKDKNITSVVFDRNGFRFHGRVKAVAEGAREGGLEF